MSRKSIVKMSPAEVNRIVKRVKRLKNALDAEFSNFTEIASDSIKEDGERYNLLLRAKHECHQLHEVMYDLIIHEKKYCYYGFTCEKPIVRKIWQPIPEKSYDKTIDVTKLK